MRLLRLWAQMLVDFSGTVRTSKKEQPDRIPVGLRRRHAG